MKRLRRLIQFARALVRGARQHWRLGTPMTSLAWGVLVSFVSPPGKRSSFRVRLARYRACRFCLLFDPVLKTCGNGHDFMAVDGHRFPAGCQCWLPLKIGVPRAQCFMTEIGLESRWRV